MFQTLQISLTKLWAIIKEHPELVKEVTFKDGHTEKMFSFTSNTSKFPDDHHTEILSAKPKDVRPASKDEWKYWEIGKAKVFPQSGAPAPAGPVLGGTASEPDEVPF